MRVPVLAILPSQEPLQESAATALDPTLPPSSLANTEVPSGLDLDVSFAAVPVGSGTGQEASLESLEPTQSERFAVRAFVDVDNLADIPEEVDGRPLFGDPAIAHFLTCGGTPPVGAAGDVANKLNKAALSSRGLDGRDVAVAIVDTGINLNHLKAQLGQMPLLDAGNSWRPPGSPAPGTSPVDHGTMCAYDALITAPRATLLDVPVLSATAPGGAVTGGFLSVALQGFAHLLGFWAVAFAPGGAPRYKALVINNSWGIFHPSWDFPPGHRGRYIDNPTHPFTALTSVLARSGADILFAAGNCGAQCADGRCQGRTTETICGANASPEVLTLAGCDTNDVRVGYSSRGPSITGMFQNKPDITAYTHFLGSRAFGPTAPDSGTSAACPVAAGCVAAIRTMVSPTKVPPAGLFVQLQATARPAAGQNGWNRDYGHGIIDPDSAAQSLGV